MCASSYWGCCYCPKGAYKITSKTSPYYCALNDSSIIYIGVNDPVECSLHDSAGWKYSLRCLLVSHPVDSCLFVSAAPLVDTTENHSGSAMLMLLSVVVVGLAVFVIYKFKR